MAIYSSSNPSSNNWILSLKLVLISSAVLSMAVVLKLSVPVVADFVASEVPSIWSVALSWLRPPYLYLLINGIIISIVASSKLQHKVDHSTTPAEVAVPFPATATEAAAVRVSSGSDAVRTDYAADNDVVFTGYGYDANAVAKVADGHAEDLQRWRDVVEDRVLEAEKTKSDRPPMVMKAGGEAVVPEPAGNALQRKDSVEFSFANENEKPPVSARFAHRKAVKASPEGGKSLGVAKPKPKRQDTLESTWKMITDGRSMPLTRHLKKADTWETHGRRNTQVDQSSPTPPGAMKKSETFNDHRSGGGNSTLSPSSGSGRLRKEPSLGQDELNRRVEAFIKKFNEEMRLQRQESLNQYQEMIGRGAH